jgi:hypothetical protein
LWAFAADLIGGLLPGRLLIPGIRVAPKIEDYAIRLSQSLRLEH